MRVLLIVDAFLLLLLCVTTALSLKDDMPLHAREKEGYCSTRPGQPCCPGRDDQCTVAFFDTVCYCDIFCNRTLTDCCPDFIDQCLGGIEPQPLRTNRPPEQVKNNCHHEGRIYHVDDRITVNCNNCTCVYAVIKDEFNWKCTQKNCLIRPELLHYVNSNATKHGWTATNYSALWGLTLDEGIKRRLGTRRPSAHITEMSVLKVAPEEGLPVEFDARKEWPGLISPVLDQKDCGSSWAFSTAGVASDRLRIHSNGVYNRTLSPQHLISCNTQHGQHGCESGHVDRAWWFIRKVGIVTNDCFGYRSGVTRKAGTCPLPKTYPSLTQSSCPEGEKIPTKVHQATPPYKISPNEEQIMKEVLENGPLQVVIEVKEDFYMYRSGVYHHSLPADYLPPSQRQTSFHSVRLIGWGVDKTTGHPRKYWLCANSWGPEWGEDGYFRILRGTDESSVESYVVGAWIKVGDRTLVQPRHRSSASLSSSSSHKDRHLENHEYAGT